MSPHKIRKIGFLGFGEAGQMMASTLYDAHEDISLYAYDLNCQTEAACARAPLADKLQHLPTANALAEQAEIIISVVTADQSYDAAAALAPFLQEGQIFADGNSVSPGTKTQTATIIRQTGAAYIDMAIMAPIRPRGHRTPLLIAGDARAAICTLLSDLGCDYSWEGDDVGAASVVKMIRSILIKGMESLICEAMTAAVPLGLDQRILTSAGKTLGIENMTGLADYVGERVAVHGRRRAAEMREVAKTLDELGLSHDMATAIARHQDRVADMNIAAEFADENGGKVPQDLRQLAAVMQKKQQS